LSVSDHGTFCGFDKKIKSGRCKKACRRKPKISVTVRKPVSAAKQRNRGRGRQKRNKFTDPARVLNDVIVPGLGGSQEGENQVNGKKDSKCVKVLGADCCSFCGPSDAGRGGKTASRRPRTARVCRKNSPALKENVTKAKNSENANSAAGVTDTVAHIGNSTAVHSDTVNFTDAMATDCDQHMDKGSELTVNSDKFDPADDFIKIRKCQKVTSKSKSRKHNCRMKEILTETKDEKIETEAAEVANVASVSESDKPNTDIDNGILSSRRSRPVKNRRLMNNCFIFNYPVKTRRQKTIANKLTAPETVANCASIINTSSEVNNGDAEIVSERTDVESCIKVSESKGTLLTANMSENCTTEFVEKSSESNLHVSDPLVDFDTQIDECRNTCMQKSNPDILNPILDIAVTEIEEDTCVVTDDCKYGTLNCDAALDRDHSSSESKSPMLKRSYATDGTANHCRLPSPAKKVCCDFDQTGDIAVASQSADTLTTEPVLSKSVDFCGMADSSNATDILQTDNKMDNISTDYYDEHSCIHDLNENNADNMDIYSSAVDACNVENDTFTGAVESDWLFPQTADDADTSMYELENMTISVGSDIDLVSVDCEALNSVTDDTDTAGYNTDYVQFQGNSAYASIDEMVEMLVTDEQENITDGASISPVLPNPDFVNMLDAEPDNTEASEISIAVVASINCVTSDITDGASISPVLPNPDFVSTLDAELDNTEASEISNAAVASLNCVTADITDGASISPVLPNLDFVNMLDAELDNTEANIISNAAVASVNCVTADITDGASISPVLPNPDFISTFDAEPDNEASEISVAAVVSINCMTADITDGASISPVLPNLDFVSTLDTQLDNTEANIISNAAVASLNCVTADITDGASISPVLPNPDFVSTFDAEPDNTEASEISIAAVTSINCVTSDITDGASICLLPNPDFISTFDAEPDNNEASEISIAAVASINCMTADITDGASISPLLPNPDFVSTFDAEPDNTEASEISVAAVASVNCVTADEHHLYCSAVIATSADSGVLIDGIHQAAISNSHSPEFSSPLRRTRAARHCRRTSHGNSRARRRNSSENKAEDVGHISAGLLNGTVSVEEKRELLHVDDLHRIRQKSVKIETVKQGTDVETTSDTTERKKLSRTSSRLSSTSLLLLILLLTF